MLKGRGSHPRIPQSEADITAVAAALGLAIPDACMPGVIANLALLDRHARVLLGVAR